MGRAKTQAREDGVWLRSRERVMQSSNIPTLYEWIGGIEALNRLTKRFYEHVNEDELLKPVFAHMDAAHSEHVAAFLSIERLVG